MSFLLDANFVIRFPSKNDWRNGAELECHSSLTPRARRLTGGARMTDYDAFYIGVNILAVRTPAHRMLL